MCEPTHSITQFPPEDPNTGAPNEQKVSLLGRVMDIGKKIKGWFHFSKLGKGHSESMNITRVNHLWVPENTKYEAFWWNRTVKFDGYFCGKEFDRALALELATQYANTVSIGDLKMLRRFLETSMQKTDRPYLYAEQFRNLLNKKGKETYEQQLKAHIPMKNIFVMLGRSESSNPSLLDKLIKIMMGITRKRDLLVPEWSDDTKLWVPPTTQILPAS